MKVIRILSELAEDPNVFNGNEMRFPFKKENQFFSEYAIYDALSEEEIDLNSDIEIYEKTNNKIEKLHGIVNIKEGTIRVPTNEELMYKINEIIDELYKVREDK